MKPGQLRPGELRLRQLRLEPFEIHQSIAVQMQREQISPGELMASFRII